MSYTSPLALIPELERLTQTHGGMLTVEPAFSLAPLTSYKLGGVATVFVTVRARTALAAVLALTHRIDLEPVILGNGTNVLISDEGLDAVVVKLDGEFNDARRIDETRVYVGAAMRATGAIRFAQQHGLLGSEGWAGIPGSVGGAVVMNGGTRAGDTSQMVESLDLMLQNGDTQTLAAADAGFAYRRSRLPIGSVVLGATLQLRAGAEAELEAARAAMRDELQRRTKTQPYHEPSCGSVFKNPPGTHAAKLIEDAGLKGTSFGGATISTRHANFIVVPDPTRATAHEVYTLLRATQERVARVSGIHLTPEVRLLGRFDDRDVGPLVAAMESHSATNPQPQKGATP